MRVEWLSFRCAHLSDIVHRWRSVRWSFHCSAEWDWCNLDSCRCCTSHSRQRVWRNRSVECNNHCRYSDHLNSRRRRARIDRSGEGKGSFACTSFGAWAIVVCFRAHGIGVFGDRRRMGNIDSRHILEAVHSFSQGFLHVKPDVH